MVIKTYSVSLDEEVVKKAKEIMKPHGGKLSPLINEFLKKFNKESEVEENGNEHR